MKLKTNNKFSKWLYKLACKFGYKPIFEPKVIHYSSKDVVKLSYAMKIPKEVNDSLSGSELEYYIYKTVCDNFIENILRQNIKLTKHYNIEDFTTTIYAKLFILDKKGLEDFYERY